jgi:hypothetical protein
MKSAERIQLVFKRMNLSRTASSENILFNSTRKYRVPIERH